MMQAHMAVMSGPAKSWLAWRVSGAAGRHRCRSDPCAYWRASGGVAGARQPRRSFMLIMSVGCARSCVLEPSALQQRLTQLRSLHPSAI
jgi:hypothetical protein